MIRAIANKPLDLSDDEFAYYLQIIEAFGPNIFQDTFEVVEEAGSPEHGWITVVTPPFNKSLPMGVIFFLFNVMLNPRVRNQEKKMIELENMKKKVESLVAKLEGQNGK